MKRFIALLTIAIFVFTADFSNAKQKKNKQKSRSKAVALNNKKYTLKIADPKARKAAKEFEEDLYGIVDKIFPAFVKLPTGSGVAISPDGYALTNYHVVASIPVKPFYAETPDGKKFKVQVLGSDYVGDITLIKLEGAENRPYVELGDSDELEVGQYSIALGNPFNLANQGKPVVTLGIISALHCYQGAYSDAVQTDAAINPGNSGGPLFTIEGKLIGINGRIATRLPVKANSRVGYAIPINQIKKFLEGLKKGDMKHASIEGLILDQSEKDGEGVLVQDVAPKSTADKAGFKKGDMIVKVDNYKIVNYIRMLGVLGIYPNGEKITVQVKRGEKTESLTFELDRDKTPPPFSAIAGRRMPGTEPKQPESPQAYLGIRFAADPADGGGVTIEEVSPKSPAAKADMRAGDIIKFFGEQKIKDVYSLLSTLKTKKVGDKVKVKVKRNDEMVELTVTLEAKPKE